MSGHATINRFYRLIWSEAQGAWIAVAENTRGRGKRSGRGAFMAALFAGLGLAPAAWAAPPAPGQLPTGGQVTGGTVSIGQAGAQMNIQQASQRGAIDWQTFNVGSQAQVSFQQPNSAAVTLNRVQDSQASQIFGRITANGQVFLSNPNGVYFSPTASVSVGGLVATTHTMNTADFMAGSSTFTRNGATGAVINDGSLQAGLGGYIAMLAPQVRNNGIVIAQAGTVAMAAGEQIALQFADSRTLAGVLVSPSAIAALVENGAAVHAPGGLIIMSAQAANQLQGGVVRNSGALEATGLAARGGKIVLDSSGLVDNGGSLDVSGSQGGAIAIAGDRMLNAGSLRADGGGAIASTLANGLVETASATVSAQGGGSIAIDGGAGKVYTSGRYQADGEHGGKVVITARDVALMGARVSATGASGGGTILVGGDYQGRNAAIRNAVNTTVGKGVTLNADATGAGNGGKVVVWSEEKTVFGGDIGARGGAWGGDGGIMEVSGKQTLHFGGTANGYARYGKSGTLLLDPKDIYIDSQLSGQLEFVDPHPTAGGSFGKTTTALTTTAGTTITRTGYVVITNPDDNLGATGSGAAYLFRQSDQALISTLYGTHVGDKVGSYAVTALANGNFVVSSNLWNAGRGAVTWGSGTTGWGAGAVALSSNNSLVGSTGTHMSSQGYATSDNVGGSAIKTLANGNYLVGTGSWSDSRGALTFGNGSTGVSGVVSSTNSLVGSTPMTIVLSDGYKQYKFGDQVGGSINVLPNDSYVLVNSGWNKGVGAVTFGSGSSALTGVVGAANSLVGDSTRADASGQGNGTDKVGKYFQALSGSRFLIYGSDWNNNAGMLATFDGANAVTGLVSSANSLVGGAFDSLSSGGVTLLGSNNAYVISSPAWNSSRGAATWVAYATNVKDVIVANGLTGSTTGDSIGSKTITVLGNNDYVVSSPNWNGTRGASTLVDGTTGLSKINQDGTVGAGNSLVGSQVNDRVGAGGILALVGNGNYLALSPYWANGGNASAGAVTWNSGSSPTLGAVSAANSLVGSFSGDRIGSYQYNSYQSNNPVPALQEGTSISVLSNGNYAVASPMWNGTRGAVTWSSGATGATADGGHTINADNSLIGSNVSDFIGGFVVPTDVITNPVNGATSHQDAIGNGITALSNGNFVTVSNYWRNGAALRAGAVTWSDGGGAPAVGAVSAANSLVGSVTDDRVGTGKNNVSGVTALLAGYDGNGKQLYSGNYVVSSILWNNGALADAGAVTWGSGTGPLTGTISDSNSVLGLKANDSKDWTVAPLAVAGSYLIQNQYWDNGAATGAGALTWIDGSTGRLSDYAARGSRNIVSAANSLVGTQANDNIGSYVDYLYNYDAVNNVNRYTGNYVALSTNWANGANASAGAVTWGSGVAGVSGVVGRDNSIVGEKAGDYLGSYYAALINGHYVVSNPNRDINGIVNAGAVSWVDGNTGRLNDYAAQGNQNIMSAANAMVGSHVNDYLGTSIQLATYYGTTADYANAGYFIISPDWNCGAGAVNFISNAAAPLSGTTGPANAGVGNPNGRFWGGLGYSPNMSLASNGAAFVTFAGDNGHVILVSSAMPAANPMWLPGATGYGDAEGATQAMTPDYIAGVLRTGTSVTLQANNDIFVKSGIDASGGVAGGALTMQAGRSIAVLGDIITGNRDLNLIANDSLANGVKDAYRDAGIATISMGSNAQGTAAVIDAGTGHVSMLMADGSDKSNAMAGSISVNSITAASIKLVNQGNGAGTVADLPDMNANCCGFDVGYRGVGADVTLNAGAVLNASGAGTAVTLAAKGNFNNNSGNGAASIALSDPGARWLVYASAPGASTFGNLDSNNTAVWNSSYTGSDATQTGNRYLFAYQPTITVNTQDVSKTYGDDLATGTALVDQVISLSGAQGAVAGAYLGDTISTAVSGAITAASAGAAANAGVAGGPYAITVDLSGVTGNNGYAVMLGSNTPRTLTVQKKTLTASLNPVSKTYDGGSLMALSTGDYVLSGLVGSESFGINSSFGLYGGVNVGSYAVTANLSAGNFTAGAGTLASNYNLPISASGTGVITPKALTAVVIGTPTKTYDGNANATLSAGNYQLLGFAGGQSATVGQVAGLYNSGDVAGASSVSALLSAGDFTAGSGTSFSNYILPTSASGAAAITPKALTASLTGSIVKTYDGTTAALLGSANYNLAGFIGSQSASVTQTAGSYNSANVVNANSVTASLSAGDFTAGSGTTLSNYVLPASAGGAASITAKALTASLAGRIGRAYDGTTTASLASTNYTLDGLVSGESFSVTKASGTFDSRNAGSRTVSTTLSSEDFTAGMGTSYANYLLPTSATGTGTITPKAIVLTAPSISKVYDGSLAYTTGSGDLSALSAALVAGDTVTHAAFSYADKNAGNGNKVVQFNSATLSDGNGGSNYSVSLAGNASSTITPRILTVQATGIGRVYDATTTASVTLGDDRVAGDLLDVSNTAASFANKNAGVNKTVTVTGIAAGGADAGNYVLENTSALTTATITPALLQVTGVTAQGRSYDTTRNALITGAPTVQALGSDVVTVTGTATGLFADKNAGVNKAVSVSGYTTEDGNYLLLQPTGLTATITPAVLELLGLNSGVSKTYDGTTGITLAGSPIVFGLGSDSVAVLGTGTGQFANKNAGTGKAITVSGFTSSDSNYTIGQAPELTGSITPAQLTLDPVTAVTRAYNGGTNAQIALGSYTLHGLVAGESFSVTKAAGTFDSRHAGSRTVSTTLSSEDFTAGMGTSYANYLLPTGATGTGTITPKAIVLTAPSISKVYDGSLAYTTGSGDLSALSAALVAGDTVTHAAFSYADKNAGNGNKVVQFNSATLSDGNGGGNYSVSLAGNASSTITPRILTVQATGIGRVYDATTTASVTLGDDRVAGDLLDVSNTAASFANKNAGVNKTVTVTGIAAGGADAGNYVLENTSALTTATITPALLQVTGVTAQNRSYDTTRNALITGAPTVQALGSDVVTVTGTATGLFADKNAGVNKAVSVSGYTTEDGNYLLLQPTGLTATITPAVLELFGLNSGVSKTYDGTTGITLAGSPIVFGLGSDSVAVLGTGTGQFANKNAGTGKAITVSGFTSSDSNYTIGQAPELTGSITPAQLTLDPVTAVTRAYNGGTNAQIALGSYTLHGLVAGESFSVTKAAGTFDSRHAGSRTVSTTLSSEDFTAGMGTSYANYLLPTGATGTGTITPKAIVLTAPSISKVYDGSLAYTTGSGDLSALSAALVAGDTVTHAAFSYADKNAGNGNKVVQFNSATLSDGNGGGNYSVSLAGNASSTITPRILTVQATGIGRVYDATTTASVTLGDDRVAGDLLDVSNTAASFANKNAGVNKTVTVTGIAAGGADAGNYVLENTSALTTATITPAFLQVTGVTAQGRSYDTTRNALITGAPTVQALGSDVVTVTGTATGLFADKNAGVNKAVSVSGYTTEDGNYLLLQPTGLTATITPAVLELFGLNSGVSKTYDGTTGITLAGSPIVFGLGSDSVAVLGTGTGQFANKNAGTGKAITVSGFTSSDSNYTIGQAPELTGSITPAQLTLDPVTAVTRAYNGGTNAQIALGSYTLHGLVAGESFSVTKAAGTFDSRHAGSRTVSTTLSSEDFTAGMGTSYANYLLPTGATGTGTITPKAIVLTAPSISKVYDGTLAYTTGSGDLSALSAALVAGDTVTHAAFSYADKNAGNGNKAVQFNSATLSDGNGGGNYSVSLAGNASSSITPRILTVQATGIGRVYDATTTASVTLGDDRVAGDLLDVSNTAASFANKNAGVNKTVTVTGIAAGGADAGNYVLENTSALTTATITPAFLQVTGVTAQGRSYDTTRNALITGAPTVQALGSDVVTVTGTATGLFADKNAGVNKAVSVSGYTTEDGNYLLLQPTGLTATITPAVLQVSGLSLAAAKTYDGTRGVALSGTPVVSGFEGETVTVGGNGGGQFADKNVGKGKVITLTGYTSSDSNYAIGQEPGLVGDITPALVTVTGVHANNKTFDGNALASLGGTAVINVIGDDEVAVTGTPGASFADATAGKAKPVTVNGYALAGADAGNYALSQPQGLSADILDAAIQVPPPIVAPVPPLPPLPLAQQRVAPGLSMPPLGEIPASDAGLSSTPPALPALAAATALKVTSTPGISVSLVRPASLQQNGAIAVSIPKEIANAGKGFGFPLPAQIVETAAVNRVPVQATLADGTPLPAWISYNADSKTFAVTRLPDGALPLQILLVIGSQRATMVMAEGQ